MTFSDIVLAARTIVQHGPQSVITGLNHHVHLELGLNVIRQLVFDGVANDVRFVQPFAFWRADAVDQKQFVVVAEAVEVLSRNSGEIRNLEALIDAQIRRTNTERPRDLGMLSGVQPVGDRDRVKVERGMVFRTDVDRQKKEENTCKYKRLAHGALKL